MLAELADHAGHDLLRAPAIDVREQQDRPLPGHAVDAVVYAQGAHDVVDDLAEYRVAFEAGDTDDHG